MNQETAAHRTQHTGPVRNFSVLLPPTPRGARQARRLAVDQLRAWELPLDPAEHLVAELVANVVTHGRVPGRDFRLMLYVIDATLRIEVTDTRDDLLPGVRKVAPDSESGRGLVIVEALAERWGVELGPLPLKRVWAECGVE